MTDALRSALTQLVGTLRKEEAEMKELASEAARMHLRSYARHEGKWESAKQHADKLSALLSAHPESAAQQEQSTETLGDCGGYMDYHAYRAQRMQVGASADIRERLLKLESAITEYAEAQAAARIVIDSDDISESYEWADRMSKAHARCDEAGQRLVELAAGASLPAQGKRPISYVCGCWEDVDGVTHQCPKHTPKEASSSLPAQGETDHPPQPPPNTLAKRGIG